jgi:hypothetical protein
VGAVSHVPTLDRVTSAKPAPSGRSPRDRSATLTVGVALLSLAFGLRATIFAPSELGLDGLLSVGIAQRGPAYVIEFSLRDVHPPLYYLLLWAWLGVVGPSFATARWLSLAAGALSLAIFFRLLAGVAGRRAAALGLLLAAVLPAAVFVDATVRDFTFGLFLSLLSFWAFRRSDTGPAATRRPVAVVALALLTVASLLTWYFHALVWLIQVVTALTSRRRLLVPLLAGGILAAPWYFPFGLHLRRLVLEGSFGSMGSTPQNLDLVSFLTSAGGALIGRSPPPTLAPWLLPAWVMLALGGAAVLARRRPGTAVLLAGGAAAALLATALLYRVWIGGEFLTRYFLLAGFPGAALIAVFLAELRPRILGCAGAGILAALGLGFYATFLPLRPETDSRAAFHAWLAPQLRPEDAVIFDDLPDAGHFLLASAGRVEVHSFHTQGPAYLWESDPGAAARALGAPADRALWRVRNPGPGNDRAARLDAALLEAWAPVAGFLRAGRPVAQYRGASAWRTLDAGFDGRIVLEGAAGPQRVVSGHRLPVALRWRAASVPASDLKVFVHLVDAEGRLVAQHDGVPGEGTRPTASWTPAVPVIDLHWVDIPNAAAPGSYTILVGLYTDHARLMLADGRNALSLGIVEVVAP